MQHDSLNDIYKPAGSAGSQQDTSLAKRIKWIWEKFLLMTYLYGFSAVQVIKSLAQNDDAAATAALDELQKKRLIKSIGSDQQQSGQLIKLTPAGVDYAEAVLGQMRGSKYNSTSRGNRKSFVRHDITSQLFMAPMINRHGDIRYLPEAAMEPSKKTKHFDVVMMIDSGQIVGIEIERTSKYGDELVSSMARTIRAIRAGDVDFVVFVLPTAEAAARYDRVLDEEHLVVSRKQGRRWMQEDVLELVFDDLMRVVCVVGSSAIWKGAM